MNTTCILELIVGFVHEYIPKSANYGVRTHAYEYIRS